MNTTDPRARLDEIKARAEDPATVSDLVAVCNDARKAHAALTAVMDIHVPEPCEPECGLHNLCAACWDDFPCLTVRALADAMEVQG